MGLVDISGVNKRILLKELWSESDDASFNKQHGIKCDINEVNEVIDDYINSGFIDYFCGRVIKTDISGDMAESRLYDRDNGVGKFQSIVDKIRRSNEWSE